RAAPAAPRNRTRPPLPAAGQRPAGRHRAGRRRHGGAHHRGACGAADRHCRRGHRRALLPLDPAAAARRGGPVSAPAMMEARGVSVRYGRRMVLAPTNLTIDAAAMTMIVGPNGAGKTTLMRVLTGERAPSTGAMLFDGVDIATLPAAALARRRAVLPQAAQLSFPFTVHEVVRLGCPGGNGTHARIANLLRRVDLDGFGDRYYQLLSGGEQQRVQLARVLAQLDQPDPSGR